MTQQYRLKLATRTKRSDLKVQLKLRVTPEIHAALVAHATDRGVSLNTEILDRLELTLSREVARRFILL